MTTIALNIEELYEQHIRALTPEQKLCLLAKSAEGLAESGLSAPQKRRIMELHGLGAEIWWGIDAQEYVNQLREEWSHRP